MGYVDFFVVGVCGLFGAGGMTSNFLHYHGGMGARKQHPHPNLLPEGEGTKIKVRIM